MPANNPSQRADSSSVGLLLITPDLPASQTTPIFYLFGLVDLPLPTGNDYYKFQDPTWNSSTNTLTYNFIYGTTFGYSGDPTASGILLKTYFLPPYLNLPSTLPDTITVVVTGDIPTLAASFSISDNQFPGQKSTTRNTITKQGQVSNITVKSLFENKDTAPTGTAPVAWVPRPFAINSYTQNSQYFVIFLALTGAEGYTNILNPSFISVTNTDSDGGVFQCILYQPNVISNPTDPQKVQQTALGWVPSTLSQFSYIFGTISGSDGTGLVDMTSIYSETASDYCSI